MTKRQSVKATENARELRKRHTEAESLLWYVPRRRRLCGLKFRRQYPIEPWIVDFACLEKKLVIELDGAYHDATHEADIRREEDLRRKGWDVIRFANDEVLGDVEAVAIAIARHMSLTPEFARPPHPNPLPQIAGDNACTDTAHPSPAIRGRGGKDV